MSKFYIVGNHMSWLNCIGAAKALVSLVSLGICAGLSKLPLLDNAISTKISCAGSIFLFLKQTIFCGYSKERLQ